MLWSTTALAAEEYPIKLDRLPKAGSVIEVTSKTEQVGDVGPVLAPLERAGVTGKYKTTASLLIRITIDEVDAAGWTTQATYKILRCDAMTLQGKTATDLKGKVFQVSVSDGRRMYLEPTGTPGESYVLDEPRASIFDLAVPLRFFKGEAGLDALFGTADPQKTGAKWTSDPKAVSDRLAYLGVKPQGVQGRTTLKKATAKLLMVESALRLTGLKFDLPEGYVLAGDELQMTFTSALPPDESALPTEQSIVRSTSVAGTIKGKQSSESIQETGRARYRLLP